MFFLIFNWKVHYKTSCISFHRPHVVMHSLKRHQIAALAVFLTCFLKYENHRFQNLAGVFFFFLFSLQDIVIIHIAQGGILKFTCVITAHRECGG